MLLLHLVKKDCLLVKKYMLFMMVVAIAIPLFVWLRIPQLLGFGAFLISVIFTEFMLYQSTSMAELKYPKAAALLSAAPYPRSALVKAKYFFHFLIFVYCYAAYSLLAWVVPRINHLDPLGVIAALFISTVLYGVYTPIQYKLGYEKTKYFFSLVILLPPFVLPALIKANMKDHIEGWLALPAALQYLLLAAAILVIAFISLNASIRIYANKELL
jgi:ABC-2 type transport system permease protein